MLVHSVFQKQAPSSDGESLQSSEVPLAPKIYGGKISLLPSRTPVSRSDWICFYYNGKICYLNQFLPSWDSMDPDILLLCGQYGSTLVNHKDLEKASELEELETSFFQFHLPSSYLCFLCWSLNWGHSSILVWRIFCCCIDAIEQIPRLLCCVRVCCWISECLLKFFFLFLFLFNYFLLACNSNQLDVCSCVSS